eukprot:7294162-Prymnesium_polylepis.1
MKATDRGRTEDSDTISGSCHATPPSPPAECTADGSRCVYYADGTDVDAAAAVAAKADVAFVFLATDSSEGGDRGSLDLDGNGDELVPAIAKAAKASAVCTTVPGAVLTPWRDTVDAITTAFMPGQEYGHALVDVLFGAVGPSAKLPLTFPSHENEVGFTDAQWPG